MSSVAPVRWSNALSGAVLGALGFAALLTGEWAVGAGLLLLAVLPVVIPVWRSRTTSQSPRPSRHLLTGSIAIFVASAVFFLFGLADPSPVRALAFLAAFFGVALSGFLVFVARRARAQGQ